MADTPEAEELKRLGLYDPGSPDAGSRLQLLNTIFSMGATVEEVQRAFRVGGLGSLSLDLSINPPGQVSELTAFIDQFADLDEGLLQKMWTAFGLPNDPQVPIRVTPDIEAAVKLFGALALLVGEDVALSVARVVGSSAARSSDALSWALRTRVEIPQRESGTHYADVVDDYSNAGRVWLPMFLEACNAVFRRHLVTTSYQPWGWDADHTAVMLQRTVGFADLVGSTAAMRSRSAPEVAAMVRSFEELVWELVNAAGGRVVKLIGDEAMFVVDDAVRAVDVARRLVERSSSPVRVGLATGEVMAQFGDFYGETVNLAARLVGAQEDPGVVVSKSVHDWVGSQEFDELPPARFKGFDEPVRWFRLRERSGGV